LEFVTLLIIGAVIGSNNLAVALALGALGQAARRFRVMLIFGIFEFFIPLFGIWLGANAARAIGLHAQQVGAILLGGLGLYAIISGLRKKEDHVRLAYLATSWGGLVTLAAGLSLDNLLIGFSLGLGEVSPLSLAITIMCFSVLFTWVGMHLGRISSQNYERMARVGSGILLVALGVSSWVGLI